MNSVCRFVAQRAIRREGLSSAQSYYYNCYSSRAAAAKPRYRAQKTTPLQQGSSPSPPPPPEQHKTYTLTSPSKGGATPAAQQNASSSRKWKRPSKIPYQDKVANSVHLMGFIQKPVRFDSSKDGNTWASTIFTTHRPSSSPASASHPLWIPIIFEGDLAHVAFIHLKENDHVYITGQLSKNIPWMNANEGEARVQVMVQDVNFVETSSQMAEDSVHKTLVSTTSCVERPSDQLSQLSYPSGSVPKSHVRAQLSHPSGTEQEGVTSYDSDGEKKDEDPWRDLIDNPQQWSDYRSKKLDGLVKPNHPDFKRKDRSQAIWLNRAPKWVLSELEGLFDNNQIKKGSKQSKVSLDVIWKDLVDNPDKWWDNRNNKFKDTHPDFKHKENGEALWITTAPAWALSKLPPPRQQKRAVATARS